MGVETRKRKSNDFPNISHYMQVSSKKLSRPYSKNNFHLLLLVPFTPKRWSEDQTRWSVVFRWSHRRSHCLHCSTYWHRCGVSSFSSLPSKVSWTSVVQIIPRWNSEKANKLTLASDLLSNSDFTFCYVSSKLGACLYIRYNHFFFSFFKT